jgi:hypothetical protein
MPSAVVERGAEGSRGVQLAIIELPQVMQKLHEVEPPLRGEFLEVTSNRIVAQRSEQWHEGLLYSFCISRDFERSPNGAGRLKE